MRCRDYLDILKSSLKVPSDYALAKQLGVTRSAVSAYRNGKSTFDHVVAAKVATLLSLPVMEVIAEVEIERARTLEQRQLWAKIKESVAAAVLAVVGIGIAAPPPAIAASSSVEAPVHYVKSRRWLGLLLGIPGFGDDDELPA